MMHVSDHLPALAALSPEKRLLLRLSSVAQVTAGDTGSAGDGSFDWNAFYQLCSKYANVSLVVYHLEKLGGVLDMPESLFGPLARHAALFDVKRRLLTGELKGIAAEAGRQGPAFILLKGPVLAYSYYPVPEMRSFIDLDFLVRAPDLEPMKALLAARGFTPVRYEENEITFGKSFCLQGLDLPIEIHTHLINFQYFPYYAEADLIALEPLWERSVPWGLGGVPLTILCPEDRLIYGCLHHFYHHRFSGLRYLSDMDAMLGSGHDRFDWDRFLRILAAMRVNTKIHLALSCYGSLFGKTPAPPDVMEAIRPRRWRTRLLWSCLPPAEELPFTIAERSYHLPKILALDRVRDLLRVAARWLFPGRRFLEHYFYLEPGEWKGVYYIIYAGRIVKKGLKRLVLRRPLNPGEITPERKTGNIA